MAVCLAEGCETEIIWLNNDHTGKRAPIEVATSPRGNITIDRVKNTYHVIVDDDGDVDPQLRHLNHFVSCEHAKAFTKRCEVCRQSPCIQGPSCPVKRPRGRPRKHPKPEPQGEQGNLFGA